MHLTKAHAFEAQNLVLKPFTWLQEIEDGYMLLAVSAMIGLAV